MWLVLNQARKLIFAKGMYMQKNIPYTNDGFFANLADNINDQESQVTF